MSHLLYTSAIHAMSGGIKLGALRSPKLRKMCRGQKATMDYLRSHIDAATRPVWIHAASLGEFEQGRPLIERIRQQFPERKILLTFFSPSGYEVRKNYQQVDAVCYLPLDTPKNVRDFLDLVNPSVAIFVKYEFWGNFLSELERREIPTYIISAIFRPSQIFFKPWGGNFRRMLRAFKTIYLQDQASADLLASIGITNTVVAGDTRFDRVTDIMKTATEMPEIERFATSGSLCVIAGSSWPQDEDIYIPWFNAHPEVKLIIAPHEFDAARIESLAHRMANGAVALSSYNGDTKPQALIVDCFGKLAAMYRYCSIAYIGGGFGTGIHNINEAAVYDLPVIFGPRYSKFKEAIDLISLGGAFTVSSREQFEAVMNALLDEPLRAKAAKTAGDYVHSQLGATDRIFSDLKGEFAQ
ncbi:MAG: 3-deoxy-D-manno-octulosonic acid transferase [Bacteroidales bacterium]|nr:3-deoxy-D-manno-octulosonic acid transferase [Bacteroidales bacterium]